MDKVQVASKLGDILKETGVLVASNGNALTKLLMEIVNSADITVEQGKRLFVLLAGTPTGEIVTILSGFITMDTGKLITLAKSAPNVKVKCVIYLLAAAKIIKWLVGLIVARKETQK